jgi:hypothetical protein
MEKQCESKFDGYRCQLGLNHSGKHANYGTDDEPVSIRWSDGGAKAVEKELQVLAV